MAEPGSERSGFHPPLRHVRASELRSGTAQTPGMTRLEAISHASVGAQHLWMGQTEVSPATASADHHHGESETAIYVVSGHPEFVFANPDADHGSTGGADRPGGSGSDPTSGPPAEIRIRPNPGDYVFVPPFTPHREENNDPDQPAVVVIARSTQEAIVVNLPSLHSPVD